MENEVFESVFAVFDYLREKGWHIDLHTPPNFEVMQLSENQLVACPMPMNPLYRGQNAIYEPCKPSLYRRSWTKEQAFERLLQMEDFKAVLQDNPEIRDMEDGGLIVNYTGLAQHYGIETELIDLTNSPLVAAFFATTTYDALTDTYSPILHHVSMGIIYFFPMGPLFDTFSGRNKIYPIGMEALKRPGEQRAYAMVMKEDDSLHHMAFGFWHNPQASLKVWNMTAGGTMLFPYDPMAEKVRVMRKYRIYSTQSLQKVYETNPDIADTCEAAQQLMEQSGCTFVDHLPFKYTDHEITYITEEYKRKYPGSFPASPSPSISSVSTVKHGRK